MKHILGIDVAKAKLDCALRFPDGRIRRKVLDNTPPGFEVLSAWLAKHHVVELHVCMEATGTYWEAVAEYLSDAGHTVSVVNPSNARKVEWWNVGRKPLVGVSPDEWTVIRLPWSFARSKAGNMTQ
ncbi:MAG: IS110 family transposase [Burkholderiales bacterium]